TWKDTVDYLQTTLKWRSGGELFIGTNGEVLKEAFDPAGDFFTASFGDSLANYPIAVCGKRCGILHQADELQAFIEFLRSHNVKRSLSLVAHSMGGLAARAYIEDPKNRASEAVFELVTYGTPHQGINPADYIRFTQ